ncbi:hypothetical protein V502_09052 [Pseudogymnoascus sp. VKM F-4520 (FW-2644)]|nr:hypothetical protein V502_09052 [Pseudogymnoascus sp. VKM F-4520 (FW-2644)]
MVAPSTRRRTRSSMVTSYDGADDENDVDPLQIAESIGRTSMSSASTTHESSGYSTPATSAVTTPAQVKDEAIIRGRPKRRMASSLAHEVSSATATVVHRAKALRNSEFALNPSSSRKRSQDMLDSEDDEDEYEDNSRDAQLARALQNEENERSELVSTEPQTSLGTSRRGRPRRSVLPKTDYASNLSEDDYASNPPSKKAKLSDKKGKARALTVPDSDEESEFTDVSSSADENDFPNFLNLMEDEESKPSRRPAQARRRPGMTPTQRRRTFQQPSIPTFEPTDDTALMEQPSPAIEPTDDTVPAEQPDTADEEDGNDGSDVPDFTTMTLSQRRAYRLESRARAARHRLETHHPELLVMWKELRDLPKIPPVKAEQPANISRELKPFQLEGLNWMKMMEKTKWGGGLLGDEMGMGKTIQAVSLIMSDYPAKNPSLVLIPPVALMQWQQEIAQYTDGTLKTFVYHGTNSAAKGVTVATLRKYDVILMSYNSLESLYRFQEKGRKRKDEVAFQKSPVHQIQFHRVILDEAHNIKQRTTGSAKACFALKADHKWCLSGTPLQNRIGEFFSLIRFLDVRPFASYFCKQCPCSQLEWAMDERNRCTKCNHNGMQHVSVFNQELLNPIQKYGNFGPGKEAFAKLRLLTDRFMLRRVKTDHSAAMELPAKEIYVDRKFFGDEENDFAGSIMNSGTRKFETYVSQGVLLNNYANIFGLIMQMRQVADHPDLILKKDGAGGQNILCCCICDEPAEDAVRSACKHDFCRTCVKNYIASSEESTATPDCPRCHLPLSIDLEQPEMMQDESAVKKTSIINRIKMENWTSSSKIEALLYDLHLLRSKNSSTKSIIFSGFTTMLQLVEWRLRRAGITTVMLDGSMTPAQRQASINAFMTDPTIECFLVSLKAGGVALNLTEASHVFIVDPWWNPAAEWQSADRCHRIGQCRPCSITRLCIEDSVESRMVMLQEKKSNMIRSTINNDETAMESLTAEDMQFLFRGT